MYNTLSYTNVSSGYRLIKDGKAFDKYFPKPDSKDTIRIFDGDVDDTVDLMTRVVWKYIADTKQIAPILKRNTLTDTCQAIWEFVYNHIQYKFDKQGLEQLRRPARSWAERKTGVDCDCMSIFVSSILTNLQIPHSFRITKYSKPAWQHVYVIVPDKNQTIAIDAVVSKFNYEKPYTAKKDYHMNLQGIDVAVLSGYDENDALSEALFGLAAIDDEALGMTDEQKMQAIYKHLLATRTAISQNPSLVVGVTDPQDFLKMLDYAIKYWHTDKREEAIAVLAQNEDKLNLKFGFKGVNEDDLEGYEEDGLGFFKKIGGALKKIGKGVVKVTKGVTKATLNVTKAIGKGALKVGKFVGKAILKFNPLSIAARAGFLLTMKLNMKKMASKLKWGYATKEQAAQKGISAQEWQRSVDAVKKVENLFSGKLQGSKNALKNAILKGKAGNLSGIVEYTDDYTEFKGLGIASDGLGIAPAAALAAAIPIVKVALDIVKKAGLFKKGEDTNADNLTQELDSSANAVMQSIESEDPEMKQVPANYSPTTALVPYSAQAVPASDTATSSGGIGNFIKANPMLALAGAGVAGLLIYQVLKPKPASRGLSGLGGTRKVAKRKPAKPKPAKRKVASKRRPIKKVKLF